MQTRVDEYIGKLIAKLIEIDGEIAYYQELRDDLLAELAELRDRGGAA